MKNKAFIFDIDGTLADKGERSPYDYSRVGEDRLITSVWHVYHALEEAGFTLILFTGREEYSRELTENWLASHSIFSELFMRKTGDKRKDCIVKKEMYEAIKNQFDIIGVFEDRKQVKQMWVENGLFVFDVNQHDLIF